MSLVATSEHPLALLVFLTALLVLLALGWSWAVPGTRTASSWLGKLFGPKLFVRSKHFLTQIETETLRHLETLFPQLRIHAQVAMSALIAPAKTLSSKERLWTRRRYGQKVVDFVLQDRRTGQVLVLVELDDWTHNWVKDHARDRITSAGGYQTIRLPANQRSTRASIVAVLVPTTGARVIPKHRKG
jgi:very-short-patch-repair endonuclease